MHCAEQVLIHRAFLSEFGGLISAASTWARAAAIDSGNTGDEQPNKTRFHRMAAKVLSPDNMACLSAAIAAAACLPTCLPLCLSVSPAVSLSISLFLTLALCLCLSVPISLCVPMLHVYVPEQVAIEDDSKAQRFARHGFRPVAASGAAPLKLGRGSVGGEEREVEFIVFERSLGAGAQGGMGDQAALAQVRTEASL